MCKFRHYVLFGVERLLGPKDLRDVGELDGAVRTDIGREEAALSLTDLSQTSQQVVEAEADRGLSQSVEFLVELSGLLREFSGVSQHFLNVALDAGLFDPDHRGRAVGGFPLTLHWKRRLRGLIEKTGWAKSVQAPQPRHNIQARI